MMTEVCMGGQELVQKDDLAPGCTGKKGMKKGMIIFRVHWEERLRLWCPVVFVVVAITVAVVYLFLVIFVIFFSVIVFVVIAEFASSC